MISPQNAVAERPGIELRRPLAEDAPRVTNFVRCCPPLEANSGYAYVLMCTHFAATSAVAAKGGAIVGFVFGYLLPDRRDTVFVWQVGIDDGHRGEGLGGRLLEAAMPSGRPAVRYLEATVAASNRASLALFRRFARQRRCPFELSPGFGSELFVNAGHENEDLVRIGPFAESA